MLFTTSWDDGYVLDLKLADMLERYGCTGTFYVCPVRQHGVTMLSEKEIRTLAQHHEIGAHSLTHPRLTSLTPALCGQEISDSKRWVEQITEKECTMFCYPFGDTNERVQQLVQEMGYKGARTTQGLEFSVENAFALPVTFQVFPFPHRKTWSRWWHPLDPLGPLRVRFWKLRSCHTPLKAMRSWLDTAIYLFEYARSKQKPFFHLWGHSREIERLHLWRDLEVFLQHVQKSGVKCVPNSVLLR